MSPSHRNLDTTKVEEYDYDDEEFKKVILSPAALLAQWAARQSHKNVILPKRKRKNDFCPPVKYNI